MTFGDVNIPAKRSMLTSVLAANLATTSRACSIASGWAQNFDTPGLSVTIELNFLTPKNLMTDAQVLALGNTLASSISETLISIEKSDVSNLTVP